MKRYRVILNYDTSDVIGQGEGMTEGSATTTEEYLARILEVLRAYS